MASELRFRHANSVRKERRTRDRASIAGLPSPLATVLGKNAENIYVRDRIIPDRDGSLIDSIRRASAPTIIPRGTLRPAGCRRPRNPSRKARTRDRNDARTRPDGWQKYRRRPLPFFRAASLRSRLRPRDSGDIALGVGLRLAALNVEYRDVR
jgi:hypothetical protein